MCWSGISYVSGMLYGHNIYIYTLCMQSDMIWVIVVLFAY